MNRHSARLVMAEAAVVDGKDGQRVRHPAVIVEKESARQCADWRANSA
jgi:hypothetical protein